MAYDIWTPKDIRPNDAEHVALWFKDVTGEWWREGFYNSDDNIWYFREGIPLNQDDMRIFTQWKHIKGPES